MWVGGREGLLRVCVCGNVSEVGGCVDVVVAAQPVQRECTRPLAAKTSSPPVHKVRDLSGRRESGTTPETGLLVAAPGRWHLTMAWGVQRRHDPDTNIERDGGGVERGACQCQRGSTINKVMMY